MEAVETKRILVVEDMAPLQEHIAETLDDLGVPVEVITANDGQDALEKIEGSDPFDVIISDITMPRMDGESLLRELTKRNYPAPVVMLTAHGQDEMVIRCLKSGACDYLVKPVSIDDLLMAVSTSLQHMPTIGRELEIEFDHQGWFEVTGGSDYSVLYRYRKFLSLLDAFHMPENVASEVRLTLEELGRNAIEWGNRNDSNKRVRFGCRILPYKVIIQIADEGEGFDPALIPDPSTDPFGHIENRKAEGKRLGGYGVHLIRNIMDKITYNAKGNVVVAIKYLERSE